MADPKPAFYLDSGAPLTVVSGRFPRTEFACVGNHYAYCRQHGLNYLHYADDTGAANPYHHKTNYILRSLRLCRAAGVQYLFWLDDDAFFWDFGRSIEAYYPSGEALISLCASPVREDGLFTSISSGQMMVRVCVASEMFFDSVLRTDLAEVRRAWSAADGMFTNGDQDAIWHRARKTAGRILEIHPFHAFNSRAHHVSSGTASALLVHFTGSSDSKRRDHAELMRIRSAGRSLVPVQHADASDSAQVYFELKTDLGYRISKVVRGANSAFARLRRVVGRITGRGKTSP